MNDLDKPGWNHSIETGVYDGNHSQEGIESMSARLPGFQGEYLWEFDIAERQLRALAEAFPAERYTWRPAEKSRSVNEVLVHIAAGNLTLLGMVGVQAAPDLYGELEGDISAHAGNDCQE